MKIRQLMEGAFEITPAQHMDTRGSFLELYRHDLMEAEVGFPLRLAQANVSISQKGVVRGVHFADVPPGQAKYVTCTSGAGFDIVVDLRVGSPTFGHWESVMLDETDRRAVYIGEGLGHCFCAMTDDTTLVYLCSENYNPARERTIHALDPDLALAWPLEEPILSERDAAAPTLGEARDAGLLPDYAACLDYYASLRSNVRTG